MAEHDFLVKLTHFANTAWPTVRLGHSVGAFDDKYPCANPARPYHCHITQAAGKPGIGKNIEYLQGR